MQKGKLFYHLISIAIIFTGFYTSLFPAEPWDINKAYNPGDTVTHGKTNDHINYWVAQVWNQGEEPGTSLDSAATTSWYFINTHDPYSEYEWEGCEDSSGSELQVCIPTWRDGAKGAYTIIHQDFCALDYTTYLEKAVEIAKKYDIRCAFATYVEKCDNTEWDTQLDLLNQGHEIVCHSYNHTSPLGGFYWFYHNDTIPSDKPDIPEDKKGKYIDTTKAKGYEDSVCLGPNATGWNDEVMAMVKMYKLYTPAWNESNFYLNVDSAKKVIDTYVYDKFTGNQYFPADKKCEYYHYPTLFYSGETHAYLDQHGYIGAIGGTRCSLSTPGDFYHPFYLNFDSYFNEDMGVFPENPYMWLTLKDMVDRIIEHKSYMVREFSAIGTVDQYWGAVTEDKYDNHLQYVRQKIDDLDLTVLTPSEAVKCRLTSNSVTEVSASPCGDKQWFVHIDASGCPVKYQNEISVIATFPTSVDDWEKLYVVYRSSTETPRRPPKKLGPRRWSVSMNPYKGDIHIYGDISHIKANNPTSSKTRYISFINGRVVMWLKEGAYSVTLFRPNGMQVSTVAFKTKTGYVRTEMPVKHLSNGFYILQITHKQGTQKHRVVLAR